MTSSVLEVLEIGPGAYSGNREGNGSLSGVATRYFIYGRPGDVQHWHAPIYEAGVIRLPRWWGHVVLRPAPVGIIVRPDCM